jgi:glycine/D-amino acid oxidase-like deaminating enzyme
MLNPERERVGPPLVFEGTAEAAPATLSLDSDIRVDVAVVGGGLTGISTALHLAKENVIVAVLEAKSIGWGASGRAFGGVVPALRKGPEAVIQHYGSAYGERIVETVSRGADLVYGLIAQYAIGCAPVRTGIITAAHSANGRKRLDKQAEYWAGRGARVAIMEGSAAQQLLGTAFYRSCFIDYRGGSINPLGYVRGLARAAIADGAKVYTQTPVRKLQQSSAGWELTTDRGLVKASRVVLATDGYTDNLFPGLSKTYIAMRGNLIVSKPLAHKARDSILPGGQTMMDTRRLYSGVRMLPDGRMQVGANGSLFGRETNPDLQGARRRVLRLFPQLDDVEWEESWSGIVGYSPSGLPHIHELAPGLFTGVGFSGRGLVVATIFGRELAIRSRNGDVQECAFPIMPMRKVTMHSFAPLGALPVVWGKRILDIIDDRRFAADRK